jgi:Ca2+-binding RTX toxin-like protein
MATYTGTAGNDTRTGTNNRDTFRDYGQGTDTLNGGNGNDTFVMTVDLWTDLVYGGAGRDVLDYSNADRGLWIDLEAGTTMATYRVPGLLNELLDQFDASLGFPAVTTTFTGIEDVVGSSYNDRIRGSSGDNVIEGGAGADLIDGGAGNDTASYANSSEAVYVNLDGYGSPNPGLDLLPHMGVGYGGDAAGDRLYSIENLIGSDHNDTLAGNAFDNVLTGGDGNDTFVFGRFVGHDTITDFDARGEDHDLIQISRSHFSDFEDLRNSMESRNGDVIITIDEHNSITLEDVSRSHLDASDFLFV